MLPSKHVSFLTLLKGWADRAPFKVAAPQPVALVLREEELTAAHWLASLQAQLAGGRAAPAVMVDTGGLPVMAQLPCDVLP